jgi:hypothetical protein
MAAAEYEGPQSGSFGESKNLDLAEKDQAARHSAPPAVVIHEILRKEGGS